MLSLGFSVKFLKIKGEGGDDVGMRQYLSLASSAVLMPPAITATRGQAISCGTTVAAGSTQAVAANDSYLEPLLTGFEPVLTGSDS